MTKKATLTVLCAMAGAFLPAIPAVAGANAAAGSKKAAPRAAATTKAMRHAWAPETVSGRIIMVDAAAKLVVVKDPNGVPFDMVVTPSTRIQAGNHRLDLQDLALQTHQDVSVRFIPERGGDVARAIRIAPQA